MPRVIDLDSNIIQHNLESLQQEPQTNFLSMETQKQKGRQQASLNRGPQGVGT